MLLWVATALAGPKQITVAYTASYDIEDLGDQICSITKVCDCTTQYTGVGVLLEEGENHVTFEGKWAVLSNNCGDALTAWTPKDGTAFHTVRHLDKELRLWAVHEDGNRDGPVPVGQVGGGRFEMKTSGQRWPAKEYQLHDVETLTTPDGLSVKATHDVSISFRK